MGPSIPRRLLILISFKYSSHRQFNPYPTYPISNPNPMPPILESSLPNLSTIYQPTISIHENQSIYPPTIINLHRPMQTPFSLDASLRGSRMPVCEGDIE